MQIQALTAFALVALCSLQGLALPTVTLDERDVANGTSASGATYTVQPGDTLYAIAITEGITTEQLEQANPDVVPTDLEVGEVLNIPSADSTNSTTS